MRLNGPRFTHAASLPFAIGIRSWMSTLERKVWAHDRSVDPLTSTGRPKLYVFWHENILLPLESRSDCHVTMLLSTSDDANILGRLAQRYGYQCVRGSTRRGAARALRELLQHSRKHHLAITPDGPIGPRRQMAQGPAYLASKLQIPVVCLGVGYDRPWRLRSWDRFAIPRPFSRARLIFSEALHAPPKLDRHGLEQWRQSLQQRLDQVTAEAQAWAESGARRPGEAPLRPGYGPRPVNQIAAPTPVAA